MPDTSKSVVSILGASHSASTMLGAMLGSSSSTGEVFHIGEAYAFFEESHPKSGWQNCVSEDACSIWTKISPRTEPEDAFHQIFSIAPCDTLIDSSKNLVWVARSTHKLNTLNIDSKLLLTLPNISYLVQSAHHRQVPNKTIYRQVQYYERAISLFDGIWCLRAESLISKPAETLSEVCDALRVPYFSGKEKYWEFEHHHKYGSAMTRRHIRNPSSATIDPTRIKRKLSQTPPELIEFAANKSRIIETLLLQKVSEGKMTLLG